MKGYFRDVAAMEATPAAKVWWGEKKGSDGKSQQLYVVQNITFSRNSIKIIHFSFCNPASTIPAPPVQLLFILDAV